MSEFTIEIGLDSGKKGAVTLSSNTDRAPQKFNDDDDDQRVLIRQDSTRSEY